MQQQQQEQQDRGKFRENNKDQFYTARHVAAKCIDIIISTIPDSAHYQWIEPSAGEGAFIDSLAESYDKIGIDIAPKADGIIEANYLEWFPSQSLDKKILVFGNPPFGKQSSLAKAFILHSCKFADIIAFILPRSFMKPSMSNIFPRRFHCIYSTELEEDSFILNGSKYNVPCVFQIWQIQSSNRAIINKIEANGFEYINSQIDYHIAFRRVGVYAGRCYKNENNTNRYSIQSHHFIKFRDDLIPYIDDIIIKINAHQFPNNTVGPRSLSKSEINIVLNAIIEDTLS
jgi:hypothetical protein